MKFFLLSGEPSGDVLGGRLIQELKALYPDAVFKGVGGENMEKAGLDIVLPADQLAVMGIWEVVGNFMRLKKLHNQLVEDIEAFNADAVITIDFPDFNFLLAKKLKKRGMCKAKLIHYVAPSVWAWRPGRAKAISKFLDGLICLFPFEPDYFKPHGLKTQFIGHPLTEDKPEEGSDQRFREIYDISKEARTMGVFFGSRAHELEKLSSTLKEAILMIKDEYPDVHLIIPTLPHLEFEVFKILEGMGVIAYVVSNPDHKWDAFAACDTAVAVSGTVGLELAYCGVPHTIGYKMHPMTWALVKYLVKVKHAHLANILLDDAIVPEFIQGGFDELKLGNCLLDLMENKDGGADAQRDLGKRLRGLLGADQEKTPSQKAAAFVRKLIQK